MDKILTIFDPLSPIIDKLGHFSDPLTQSYWIYFGILVINRNYSLYFSILQFCSCRMYTLVRNPCPYWSWYCSEKIHLSKYFKKEYDNCEIWYQNFCIFIRCNYFHIFGSCHSQWKFEPSFWIHFLGCCFVFCCTIYCYIWLVCNFEPSSYQENNTKRTIHHGLWRT